MTVRLRYGEIHVGGYDGRDEFATWARDKFAELWQRVEDPDGDPPPLVLVHLFDPIEQEAVTHIHSPEVAWFNNMSRRHELAGRIGLMCDLAPIQHVAFLIGAIEYRPADAKGMGQDEYRRRHEEVLAMYGTLTNAWKAGVTDVGELAQVIVASVEGPILWTAPVVRDAGKAPRVAGWERHENPDGPLIDPIQEAMNAR